MARMARHVAPEGRHRRQGELLAQAALVVVLVLVAIAVLFGSGVARDSMRREGRLTGLETAAEAQPRVGAPGTPGEAPTATSAPPAGATTGRGSDATDPDSSDRVNSPESRGVTASTAPKSTTEAEPFTSCSEPGARMIPRADPRYNRQLDRDRDGVACDRHGDPPTPPPPVPAACVLPGQRTGT